MIPHAPIEANLDDLALLEVTGPDAAAFLQGQLTQDISASDPALARLAGYCSPKGRLMASMIVWHGAAPSAAFFILLKKDIAAPFAARLAKFVLRAKVSIRPLAARIGGVTLPMTDEARESLARPRTQTEESVTPDDENTDWLAVLTSGSSRPYDITHSASGTWIAAPAGHPGLRRWWRVTPEASGAAAGQPGETDTAPLCFAGGPASDWQAQDIAAGLAWVVSATQELFIPQTLNFDLIGGLSFTKGCYPGQEVVARSHYRGTVKRRMARGTIQAPESVQMATLPGSDIYDHARRDAPGGRIINAACSNGAIHV
jgi:folate-binding protein YgfZ